MRRQHTYTDSAETQHNTLQSTHCHNMKRILLLLPLLLQLWLLDDAYDGGDGGDAGGGSSVLLTGICTEASINSELVLMSERCGRCGRGTHNQSVVNLRENDGDGLNDVSE